MRLQRCACCGKLQYPPREFCGNCLHDTLEWDEADAVPARVLARTRLQHSNEATFRERLPLTIGLVQFDAGPVAVCFLAETAVPGDAVKVRLTAEGLLEAP